MGAGDITAFESSPRPWGCFRRRGRRHCRGIVFPTPVGVFLFDDEDLITAASLPHARGGVSKTSVADAFKVESSPRPWGCFRQGRKTSQNGRVFPTPVGVFPGRAGRQGRQVGLPHARGGVSYNPAFMAALGMSSPRPWGCFLSSTI